MKSSGTEPIVRFDPHDDSPLRLARHAAGCRERTATLRSAVTSGAAGWPGAAAPAFGLLAQSLVECAQRIGDDSDRLADGLAAAVAALVAADRWED